MRPRKSDQQKRIRPISYRLTDAEYLPLEAVAKQSGLRVNELARRLAIQAKPDAHQTQPLHAVADPAVIKRLDRAGWNLNQLVRNAHIYKNVPPVVAELCEESQGLRSRDEAYKHACRQFRAKLQNNGSIPENSF